MAEEKEAPAISDEMREAAKKGAAASKKKLGASHLRTRGSRSKRGSTEASDIDYPAEIHGEDFEAYGPYGFAAEIPEGVEMAEYSEDQQFILDASKVEKLHFDPVAGRNLSANRLYTVKALKPNGVLGQLPFEAQIQNTGAGDLLDAIGLRRYQRKGFKLLFDFDTMLPVYCAALDCWARAMNSEEYPGFCSEKHAKHTLPNNFKNAGAIMGGLLEQGVTTSAVWGMG